MASKNTLTAILCPQVLAGKGHGLMVKHENIQSSDNSNYGVCEFTYVSCNWATKKSMRFIFGFPSIRCWELLALSLSWFQKVHLHLRPNVLWQVEQIGPRKSRPNEPNPMENNWRWYLLSSRNMGYRLFQQSLSSQIQRLWLNRLLWWYSWNCIILCLFLSSFIRRTPEYSVQHDRE